MEEDEEREDMCTRPVSWGCGRLAIGEDPCTSDVDAMVLPQWWRGSLTLERVRGFLGKSKLTIRVEWL